MVRNLFAFQLHVESERVEGFFDQPGSFVYQFIFSSVNLGLPFGCFGDLVVYNDLARVFQALLDQFLSDMGGVVHSWGGIDLD